MLKIMDDRINISDDKDVEAYYEESVLKEAFEKKYAKLIYLSATSKKENSEEYLWFDEAYRLEGFSFRRFSELVGKGIIKLDLRVGHYPKGRLYDHGRRQQPNHPSQACSETHRKPIETNTEAIKLI